MEETDDVKIEDREMIHGSSNWGIGQRGQCTLSQLEQEEQGQHG